MRPSSDGRQCDSHARLGVQTTVSQQDDMEQVPKRHVLGRFGAMAGIDAEARVCVLLAKCGYHDSN